MSDHRPFEAITHAVGGRRYSPLAIEKKADRFLAEFVVLRSQHDTDRAGGQFRHIDAAFGPLRCRADFQFVVGLQWPWEGAAKPCAYVHGKASKHWLALNRALDGEVTKRALARGSDL